MSRFIRPDFYPPKKGTHMKKLLTTGAILAAGASLVNAETLLQLPESKATTHEAFFYGNQSGERILEKVKDKSYGVYAGNNGGSGGSWVNTPDTEGYWTQDSTTTGHMTLAGRNGTQGESFALVLGNELSEDVTFSSVKFSIEIPQNANLNGKSFNLALGYWSSETSSYAKQTSTSVRVDASSVTTADLELVLDSLVSWKSGDKIVAGVGGPGFSPVTGTYSVNVKSVSVVPEASAFGLLGGLGVLALASSRRRRK